MSEYVEKQALDDAFASLIPWAIANEIDAAYEQGLCAAHNALLGFPAADVAPVIHARWIASYAEGETFEGYTEKFIDSFQCSSCGNYAVPDSPYCPHCGAKMENADNIGAP